MTVATLDSVDTFGDPSLQRALASRIAAYTLALPRSAKQSLAAAADLASCVLATWLAFYLRLGELLPLTGLRALPLAAAIALALPLFWAFGLYRAIFRYSGWPALLTVARAVGTYGILYGAVFTVISIPGIPRTVGIIQPILMLLMVGATRLAARYWLGGIRQRSRRTTDLPGVLVYGAGVTGRQIATAMANSPEMRVVGFLDDDERLHGHVLNGLPIHAPTDLPGMAASGRVRDVLLAIPSTSRSRRNQIIESIRSAQVSVRTLPSLHELASGRVSVSEVRELDIDDLLGREPVAPNHVLLASRITGRRVLVTGAGGSIGSELCRQIAALRPASLILVDHSEFALYRIQQELEPFATAAETGFGLFAVLASVRDARRMDAVFAANRPQTVYHAAAYKHVPLVEGNLAEGVLNNVFGTQTTAEAAIRHGVADLVLVSTDKAVRPTNIMGASKRLAEMVLQALSAESSSTRLSMVRFGNVLGSSGSVVPLFRRQIRSGGPVTLTHPEVTRYFMTIPEAAQLVIQAGAMAQGGEVFVLDMGEPVRILDLARRMVELSGLSLRSDNDPDGDIAIEIVGLRPGEKLYEELLIGDNPEPTQHPRIMRANEEMLSWTDLKLRLRDLLTALNGGDTAAARETLRSLVAGYVPADAVVEPGYLGRGRP